MLGFAFVCCLMPKLVAYEEHLIFTLSLWLFVWISYDNDDGEDDDAVAFVVSLFPLPGFFSFLCFLHALFRSWSSYNYIYINPFEKRNKWTLVTWIYNKWYDSETAGSWGYFLSQENYAVFFLVWMVYKGFSEYFGS